MLVINDVLDAVFLGCFFFGLIFSAVSLLLGAGHLGIDHGHHGVDHGDGIGPVNVSTLLAFLAWFGGVGYLARHGLGWYSLLSIAVGLGGGLVGAAVIFWVLSTLIRGSDTELRASDYRLPGTLARVTSSIRAGGTGEIVYQQGGVRQVAAARSTSGEPIARETEVVVLRSERGVAFVEPWEALLEDHESALGSRGESPVAALNGRLHQARQRRMMEEQDLEARLGRVSQSAGSGRPRGGTS